MTTASLTKQDLAQAANDINQQLSDYFDQQSHTIKSAIEQINYDQPIEDLDQKLMGQQARIDKMTADKTQAERMASADHSLLEQLKQNFAQTIKTINHNTDTESRLINQLQQPIQIDGAEVINAIEEAANSSVQQMVSKQTVQYIHSACQSIRNDRNHIDQSIKRLEQLSITILIVLIVMALILIVPWWPVRLLILITSTIGGIAYGILKNKLG